VVVSVAEKAPVMASGVDREGEREWTTAEASKAYRRHRNRGPVVALGRAWRVPADWPGGDRRRGGASSVLALAGNVGTCRPG